MEDDSEPDLTIHYMKRIKVPTHSQTATANVYDHTRMTTVYRFYNKAGQKLSDHKIGGWKNINWHYEEEQ